MTTLYPKPQGLPSPQHPVTFRVAIAFFRGTEALMSVSPCSRASLSPVMRCAPSGNGTNGPGKKYGSGGGGTNGTRAKSRDSHLDLQLRPCHRRQSWTEIKRQVRDPPGHSPPGMVHPPSIYTATSFSEVAFIVRSCDHIWPLSP